MSGTRARERTSQDRARTSQEKKTVEVKARFARHIKEEWPGLVGTDETKFDFGYIASDDVYELYWYEIPGKDKPESKTRLWLLWDGEEVYSDQDPESFIGYFVVRLKERRITNTLRYYTSPLFVSAVLAVGLAALIFALLVIPGRYVPPQLWTVFTAVVAFYFGRGNLQGGRLSREDETPH